MSFIRRLTQPQPRVLEQLDMQVFTGTHWLSLNDRIYLRLGARTLSESAQSHSSLSSKSTMFHGEWVFHSTKENVQEIIEVIVESGQWSEIESIADQLIEAFSQQLYEVRMIIDDHQETWRCFPADYTINRSHTNMHNFRQVITFSVPRLPDVTKEVLA